MELKIVTPKFEIRMPLEDELDFFKKYSFFATMPRNCGNCGSDEVAPMFKVMQQKYDYYSLECCKCHYEFKYGVRKTGGLFPKAVVWVPPYARESGGSNTRPPSEIPGPPAQFTEDDIPF